MKKMKYRPYAEARAFVHALGLKSYKEWGKYSKSGKRPLDIPSNPRDAYKNSGWIDNYDWLGTIKNHLKPSEYRSYEDAKKFLHPMNFKNVEEWTQFCKSGNKPKDIPNSPRKIYDKNGWISWGDFLGTGRIASQNMVFKTYEEAKEYIKQFNVKSKSEWSAFSKSDKKPADIPGSPDSTYKRTGEWISWGDFLSTGTIAPQNRVYKTYEEAVAFLKPFRLKNYDEWAEFSKSGKKPMDIPTNPELIYKNKGWVSYAHFLSYLGNGNTWTKTNLIHYLEEMRDYLQFCSIPQLLIIITSNGLNKYIKNNDLKNLQDALPKTQEREDVVQKIISNILSSDDESESGCIDSQITDSEVDSVLNPTDIYEEANENSMVIESLKGMDKSIITEFLDEDRIKFLINDSINNLWYDVLNNKIQIESLENAEFENSTPKKIKEDFLKEYNKVINLKLPEDWIYQNEPLLMQKLIAYRLKEKKKYGNWSSVGSGKTISAILAGLHVGAKNTLVITFNSTIGNEDQRGWLKEIKESVKDANIYSKAEKNVKFDNSQRNYLVLNYESFQQANSEEYVSELLKRNKFDYIVLDEVQNVKQVLKAEETKRRKLILKLIEQVQENNPYFYLLAMSATPIINNLIEAKSLLEMIHSKKMDEIKTASSISNCMEIFQRLTNCGIRYRNISDNYLKSNRYTLLELNGNHLLETARHIKKENYLIIDRLLLETKLKAVLPYINSSKGKTIIYTHYVDGIDEYIYEYLTNIGYKVGVYTGSQSKISREESLNEFLNGEYDILIGSKPIGTGVDGLQKVSDRMIILSLPWTNAELVQLVGRINRKGSEFTNEGVDVIIPLVSIETDGEWYKWDYKRYNAITYKKTIANAAVDGIIPDKIIQSKESFVKGAEVALPEWIDRLKNQPEVQE